MQDVEPADKQKEKNRMRAKILVLCWLAVVVMVVAGCATGRNKAAKAETTEKPYIVRKIILPTQKAGPIPFIVRALSAWRIEKDFVPAMVVSEYLETIAASGRLPLRVKEGILFKVKGEWCLAEIPPDTFNTTGCVGPRVFFATLKNNR